MDYLKYYFLEGYLFGEVRKNFKKRGYLTAKEFFCIVIWKRNASKTYIKRSLLKDRPVDIPQKEWLKKKIKEITKAVHEEKVNKGKLAILLKQKGIGLAIASAILTVLYQSKFTIYDWRVCEQLNIRDFAGRKNQIKRYFNDFLPRVNKIGQGKDLRNKDRYLWGKSFYEDLIKFLSNKKY